jgi:two-component system alkaline phosphatase synthesis response regulator PhoP
MDLIKDHLSMSFSKETLLLVEDEEALAEGLKFNFEREGFRVLSASNGRQALELIAAEEGTIQIVLLDIMLPEVDGFEVLAQMRAQAFGLPVLVLSAKSQESDKVKALEFGADDYVTKPFSLQELILRVRGIIKRTSWIHAQKETNEKQQVILFGNGRFLRDSLTFEGQSGNLTKLSPTEAALLLALCATPNTIHTRQSLLKQVWQYEPGTETRTVDVFISKLRRIVETNEKKPEFLLSIRGAGYAYVTDPRMRQSLSSQKTDNKML